MGWNHMMRMADLLRRYYILASYFALLSLTIVLDLLWGGEEYCKNQTPLTFLCPSKLDVDIGL